MSFDLQKMDSTHASAKNLDGLIVKSPNISICDTTLHNGAVRKRTSLSIEDKLRIAERLDLFGIHYIECGAPGANPADAAFFQVARNRTWKHARLVASGAPRRTHLTAPEDRQLRRLLAAEAPTVAIVGNTSHFHITERLRIPAEDNLAIVSETIRYLKSHGREVIYKAAHFFDAFFKQDERYAVATVKIAAEAGADIIVLTDTNGGSLPGYIGRAAREVAETLDTVVGIQTFDDCGLAVANALAGVWAGVAHVQGSVNGYGERAGCANLISVIGNLHFKMNKPVVGDISQLHEVSRFVDQVADVPHNSQAPFIYSGALPEDLAIPAE